MDPKEIEFLVKNMDCSPITPSKTRFVGTHQPVTGVENPSKQVVYLHTNLFVTTMNMKLCMLNISRPMLGRAQQMLNDKVQKNSRTSHK